MSTLLTKDGTEIYFKDWGSGKPVLFSHGWPLDADMWEYQMEYLSSRGYRTIAFDRRGFGRSDQPWTGNDYDTFADDIAELINHLDLQDVTLVGFSMGGGDVARYIARHGRAGAAGPVVVGGRLPFMHVLGRVLPHGCGLALGSIGFGTIATFITLYYATQHWDNAVLCLSLFGASFIGARLLFGNLINRIGGFRVAIACLSVETLGLLLLWLAPDPHLALAGAALSGFGFSLVFPALGVEAVNLVPASSRGAAVGAYSLFIDLSLGITGPLAGAIAAGVGFASIFLFAAIAAFGGLLLSLYLYRQAPKYREEREAA